ncbi:MAG: hypothetical protein RLZZ24_864, partial [Pseudomonadota bacterium]
MAISNITSTSNYYSQAVQSGPVTVDVAIAALKANPRLKVTISDTTANIAQYAESLSKLTNSVTSITQSDPSAVMNFSAAQLTKYTPLLAKFSSDYKLNISDAPTRMLDALGQNSHVTQYSITDTSANVNTA